MKICQVCKNEKSESEFYKHKTRPDGLRANCIECGKKLAREMYYKNPEPYKKRANKWKKIIRERRKEWINSIRMKTGCCLCHEQDVEVLDFHHFKGEKKEFNITSDWDREIEKLVNEINKCVVLCSNCHRRVHAGTREIDLNMLCKISIPNRSDGKQRH